LEDKGEAVVAVVISTLAAAGSAVLGMFVSMLLGQLLFRVGLMAGEGAAWSGISLGVPIGIACAIIAFLYCFHKIRAYGKPQ
jgi:ABC-type phosphate transport system permease subunit